jgi:UDP-2,3-diacylglucosamine hydrolase
MPAAVPDSLPTPVYVLADAHLGVALPEQERLLWSFLAHVRRERGSLVMNGDMFEFWFEWGHVVPHVGVRLLAECAQFAEQELPVLWIIGNHDCWGGDVLRRESGAAYLDGPWTGTLAGWRAHVAHGDGLRPELDKGYRALRAVIRHRWAVRAFRLLHPDWGAAIARATSHTSRNVRPRDGGEGLRAVAHQTLAGDASLDVVIYGHTHIAMLEHHSREAGLYANPGAWLNEPTFLKFTPELVSLGRWDGTRECAEVELDRSAR